MDIGFVWDETKYQKVLADHGVKFYEVVAAFDDPNAYETPNPVESHENHCLMIARTPWGRLLAIVFTDQDSPLHRLVTAYDANERLHNEYYGRNGSR